MMDKWEAKQAYADRKNRENAKIETLTEEQHNALAELCSIRHEVHTSGDDMFNVESGGYDMWEYFPDDDNPGYINCMLEDAGLPTIDFNFAIGTPSNGDYYVVLTQEEQDVWEERAEEINKENPELTIFHNGYSLWKEKSWEYEGFAETKERINKVIEKYLTEIDKEHGTSYCPTGHARLF